MPLLMNANASRSRSLDFWNHANAAHPRDHPIARFDIAQTPAPGFLVPHHNQGVHALILHFHPVAGLTHVGFVVGGGI